MKDSHTQIIIKKKKKTKIDELPNIYLHDRKIRINKNDQ